MKKKVLVIFGGRSAEHEVSILSARNVVAALDREAFDMEIVGISQEGSWYNFSSDKVFEGLQKISDSSLPAGAEPVVLTCENGQPLLFQMKTAAKKKIDVVFPVLHGTYGEDGTIQGLFKIMNLPFVGCGVFGSAAGMDKEVMKRLLRDAAIPSARYSVITAASVTPYTELAHKLGSPFFIKPASQGSSVGVHKIKNEADYNEKIRDSLRYDHKVLAEELMEGREIECSVMGLNNSPVASLCGEVAAETAQHEFYSYEAKYLDSNGAKVQIPARVTEDEMKRLQETARRTFQVMGCDGLSRVDFFLKKNGEVFINEINTLPGFTNISMYPKMWEATGVPYRELISKLIGLAFAAFERDRALKTMF